MYSESRILRSSGYLPPPSPPTEKATARQDQAGKSSTGDGAGDGDVAFNQDQAGKSSTGDGAGDGDVAFNQDQAGKSSTGDGAGDGDVAFNLDIIDAQIEEVYVISFCKAYLIDARSQRPEVDAIGCPRIGVCTGVDRAASPLAASDLCLCNSRQH